MSTNVALILLARKRYTSTLVQTNSGCGGFRVAHTPHFRRPRRILRPPTRPSASLLRSSRVSGSGTKVGVGPRTPGQTAGEGILHVLLVYWDCGPAEGDSGAPREPWSEVYESYRIAALGLFGFACPISTMGHILWLHGFVFLSRGTVESNVEHLSQGWAVGSGFRVQGSELFLRILIVAL